MKFITIIFNIICFFIFFIIHSEAGVCLLEEAEVKKVQNACIECFDSGVMVCGDRDIQANRNFRHNFYQGVPPKGFFITPPFLISEFKTLVRNECSYENLKKTIEKRFSQVKLVSVSHQFEKVSVFKVTKVVVTIPKELHSCLMDKNKKWGCGVSKNRELECCEKKLGSPSVSAIWIDNKNSESLELIYIPNMGSTKLIRKNSKNKKVVYFCQNNDLATLSCNKEK